MLTSQSNGVEISLPGFSLSDTLDCGQAFRWEQTAENAFSGIHRGKNLTVSQNGDTVRFWGVTEEEFSDVWAVYFDLDTDYNAMKAVFSADPTLKKACRFCGGIRLLRQDPWEALCSFIISQNNNIPRIKGIVGRAKYILDAARKVSDGTVRLDKIPALPMEEARAELQKISGVGPKVAECALLYGFHRLEAFPVDTWIKKALAEFYPQGFPAFAEPRGVAQQYLFHYIRRGNPAVMPPRQDTSQ